MVNNIESGFTIGAYNAYKGAYEGYSKTAQPTRLKYLVNAIPFLRAAVLGLTDTYRWDTDFSSEQLSQKTGYEYAMSVPLNDKRLQELGHDNGVTLLSNYVLINPHPIHLETRQGLIATIEQGHKPINVSLVYLDDKSESCRCDQAEALVKILPAHQPAIIVGDLNAINTKDFRFSLNLAAYVKRSLPRLAAVIVPKLKELVKGDAVRYLESEGFVDAGAAHPQPTVPTPLLKKFGIPLTPLFRLDYLFYRGGITIENIQRHTEGIFKRASDHYPITGEVKVKNTRSGTVFHA